MAKAPNVQQNESRRAKESRTLQRDRVLTLQFRGEKMQLSMFDLGPGDDEVSRRQAGFAISGLLMGVASSEVGLDTVAKMLWFTRRKNGERTLTWREFGAEYPNYGRMIEDLGGVDTLTFEGGDLDDEDEGDDPKDLG